MLITGLKLTCENEDVKASSEACLDATYHYLNNRVSLENYINNALKPADVLCVAGDTCDDPNLFVDFYKAVSPRYKKIFVVFGNHDLTIGNQSYFRNNPFTTFFYFNGQKYLAHLKDQSIWLAGHTHSARAKDLVQGDGRRIHLKLNPVGYPDKIQEMQKEWMSF